VCGQAVGGGCERAACASPCDDAGTLGLQTVVLREAAPGRLEEKGPQLVWCRWAGVLKPLPVGERRRKGRRKKGRAP
jgi:hypothetical protein